MLLFGFALQGCGVKGQLVLPTQQNDQETTQGATEKSTDETSVNTEQ